MDLVKELKKQAEGILKDEKKKEKAGDMVENALREVKKNVKDENKKKMIDSVIKKVDAATTSKKKKKK